MSLLPNKLWNHSKVRVQTLEQGDHFTCYYMENLKLAENFFSSRQIECVVMFREMCVNQEDWIVPEGSWMVWRWLFTQALSIAFVFLRSFYISAWDNGGSPYCARRCGDHLSDKDLTTQISVLMCKHAHTVMLVCLFVHFCPMLLYLFVHMWPF